MTTLRIKLLTDTARAPMRAEPGSIGYDIYADLGGPEFRQIIQPGMRARVKTGFAAAIPPFCYGRIAPRSGLADKAGIDVLAGVIDPSYRGEIMAILLNTGDEPFVINHWDRVAQFILEAARTVPVVVVQNLDETERGTGGFGSTGVSL